MTFTETELGKPADQVEYPVCRSFIDTPGSGSGNKAAAPFLQLGKGVLPPHRLSQLICLARRKIRNHDCHLEYLLLEQDHAECLVEHGLKQRMEIKNRLDSPPPPHVRMDHVALQGPGPYDRHLHTEVFQGAGLHPWQRLHLRPALHLEYADRV